MAKAAKFEQFEITLTLTKEEAILLRRIVGSINDEGPKRDITDAIYYALEEVIPQGEYGPHTSPFAGSVYFREH